MLSTNGDNLFSKALLTCARGNLPRDGGAALGAFADWLQEQIDEQVSWVGCADPESTGFALVVMQWRGQEWPVRVTFLMTEDPAEVNHEAFENCGKEFREWFAKAAHEFWCSQ